MKTSNLLPVERMIREMELCNYSPRTIKTYSVCMSKLQNFSGQPIEKISNESFKDYLHERITNDVISPSLINQFISAFKIMQVDVFGRDWERLRIKRPRRESTQPVVLTKKEMASMISQTTNLKHKALIALAYSSGIRRQEAQTMKPGNIDSAAMRVHVIKGKGKKDRYTLLSQTALELLRVYFRKERPSIYLFEPLGKKGHCLGGTTLNKIVKNAASRAGIKKRVCFHTLRHCFATHLLENGVSLKIIQKFMGHSSIKTTAIYLQLADINMTGIISPLDGMEGLI